MPQPSVPAVPAAPVIAQAEAQVAQLTALQMQRDMVSEQLQRVMAERGRIGQERLNAKARGDGDLVREYDASMARYTPRVQELERSLQEMDARIERAIKASNGEDVVAVTVPGAPVTVLDVPSLSSTTGNALAAQRVEFERIMAVEAGALLLLGAVLWRLGFARGKRVASRQLPTPAVDAAREERMQQAIDAIAIEVERLSEGQRFTNTLLSGRRGERESLPATPGRSITPH